MTKPQRSPDPLATARRVLDVEARAIQGLMPHIDARFAAGM